MSTTTVTLPTLPRIAMIGVGGMGSAILRGLLSSTLSVPLPISVTTRTAASAANFANIAAIVASSSEDDPAANSRVAAQAELLVLAVKPWMLLEVAREIAPTLPAGAIVVSVAAGVPCAAIEAVLPKARVVRVMPNTPAEIGRGVSGVAAGSTADRHAVETTLQLFATVGEVLEVAETQIDAVAAVSGSGPAYLFLYVEEMLAAAERLGFTPAQARTLVHGTISGAAQLLTDSNAVAAQLRRRVTSPQGTTEQAINVLQNAKWGELFDRALAANIRRSQELAQ